MTQKNNSLAHRFASVVVFATIIALILVAGVLLAALWTFNPSDPAWSHNNGGAVTNALGVAGAWYSDLSYSLLGKLGYLIPIALLAIAVHAWFEKGIDKELLSWRLFMVLTALLSGCVLWTKHDPQVINTVAQTGGGALGAWLTVGLEKSIKSVPVIMGFSLVVFVISMSLLCNFPWLKVMDGLGKGISRFFALMFSGFAAARAQKKAVPSMNSHSAADSQNEQPSAPERVDSSVAHQMDIVKALSEEAPAHNDNVVEDSASAGEQRRFTIDRYQPEEDSMDVPPRFSADESLESASAELAVAPPSSQTAPAEEPPIDLAAFGLSHPVSRPAKAPVAEQAEVTEVPPAPKLASRTIPVDISAPVDEMPFDSFSAQDSVEASAQAMTDAQNTEKAEPTFFDFNRIKKPSVKIPDASTAQDIQRTPPAPQPVVAVPTPTENFVPEHSLADGLSVSDVASHASLVAEASEVQSVADAVNKASQSIKVDPNVAASSIPSFDFGDFSLNPTPTLSVEQPTEAEPQTQESAHNTQQYTQQQPVQQQPVQQQVQQPVPEPQPVSAPQPVQPPVAPAPTVATGVAGAVHKTTATIGKAYDKQEHVDEVIERPHEFPSIDLLDTPPPQDNAYTEDTLAEMALVLETTLKQFNVVATVMHVSPGPVITRFEIDLAPGIQAKKITNLSQDLARALAVSRVRVEEVIAGSSYVGLEVPNQAREIVYFKDVVRSKAFQSSRSPLTISLGSDTSGKPVVADLMKMPHALVAGTTGSGKSVCINVMLLSMLYKASPKDLRLILVDPKMLEMSMYEDIPHLLTPVITDMNEAENALTWAVGEMERRYQLMAALKVRKIDAFNQHIDEAAARGESIKDPLWQPDESVGYTHHPSLERLPFIVIVIDELADMMMVVGKQVEQLIARLTQKARAAGIHVVLATQRPSTDVLTGLIKANVPTRIAFQVSSGTDSRVIIDGVGAEKLLGHGDMLYVPPGASHPQRLHGAFVGDAETDRITDFLRATGEPNYIDGITGKQDPESLGAFGAAEAAEAKEDADPLYEEAVQIVLQTGKASISSVQRQLRIGYNRAARMIEDMQEQGIVSEPVNGVRKVLAAPPPKDVI